VIELSQRELQRVKVIENAVMGHITVAEAAGLLNLSPRQVKRLKQRCVPGEVDWARHGNRGQRRPWRIPERTRAKTVKLASSKYAGFNDSHLTEKLQEVEGLALSRETVRRILREAGLPSPQKRRAPRYRSRRERRPRRGMMALTDASRELWLEDRGPELTLIGFQDDATGEVLAASFQVEFEDTLGYLRVLRAMVDRHGIPLSLYRDRHGAFQRNDNHWSEEEWLAGRQGLTQLGRVMEELGIEQIAALTAQAKGRIERLWRTFQDRLRSELRLAKSKTVEQANAVLARFVTEHNRKFAKAAREAGNDFRALGKEVNRDRLFSLRYERTVGHDHTISFGARSIQLPAAAGQQGYAGKKVELSHQLNGELHVWLGNRHLYQCQAPIEYTAGMAPKRPVIRPKSAQKKKRQPRIYTLGGRAALAVR
jgi:transposase